MKTEQWKTWGLPVGDVDLREWQDGRCAWCGYDRDGLVRDHCHETGLIRGLLCRGCNRRESVRSLRMNRLLLVATVLASVAWAACLVLGVWAVMGAPPP